MTAQIPPPLPSDPVPRAGWWRRHWKWAVPVIVAVLLGVFLGAVVLLIGGIGKVIRSSDVYTVALQQARAHPDVIAALGTPIEDGFLPSGSVSTSGSSGQADLTATLTGPNGSARLYIVAERARGRWDYEILEVAVDDGTGIDLRDTVERD